MAEHDEAVADARGRLAELDPATPLGPLPPDFAATRAALHRAAEELLKPKRVAETGNEIALGYTPGGFGTPRWPAGATDGVPGRARAEGTEVVLEDGSGEHRAPLADPEAAAALLGVPAPGEAEESREPPAPEAAAALADWLAFATVVLAAVHDATPGPDPEPIRLWPEHFDIATTVGDESAGTRATFGASPGDADHDEPYLYVLPFTPQDDDGSDLWNATGFTGAELGYAELLGAANQPVAAGEFFGSRAAALTGERPSTDG
jgi:hypothetical protein